MVQAVGGVEEEIVGAVEVVTVTIGIGAKGSVVAAEGVPVKDRSAGHNRSSQNGMNSPSAWGSWSWTIILVLLKNSR